MRRRDFVATGALGFGSSLIAGCSRQGPDFVTVRRIIIFNTDNFDSRRVDVNVEYNGDTIHDDVHDVPVADGPSAGTVIVDDLPDEAGSYRIRIDVQDDEQGATVLNSSEMDRVDCVDIEVSLFDDVPYRISVRNCREQ